MDSRAFNSSVEEKNDLLWYQCRTPYFFLYIACDFTNSLLGLPTNLWVLALILKDWRAQAAQEAITLNLAFVEILYCFLSQGLVLNFLVFKIHFISESFWFVFGLNLCGRCLFQCGMSVERYLAVVHPVFFFRFQSLKYKVMFLIVAWPLIIILSSFNSSIFAVYTICCLFLLVLAVDTFCSVSILKVLRQPVPGNGGRKTEEMNLIKKKASRTILIIQASVMFNYIPAFLGAALQKQMSEYFFSCVYRPVGFSFSVIGSFIQPLLYLHRMGKLQCIALKRLK